MTDVDRLGEFYLGRRARLVSWRDRFTPLLYDSKDLTTHAVCVGMTGSGKTGLCLSLLEEAALDGIPAIAIDPKGDLGNLLLAFPKLAPRDFRPWIDESEAARKGMSPDEFAASRPSCGATAWRSGTKAPSAFARYCRRGRARDLHARQQRGHSAHGAEVVRRAAGGADRRSPMRFASGCRRPPRDCWRCWASTPTRSAAASTSSCRHCSTRAWRAGRDIGSAAVDSATSSSRRSTRWAWSTWNRSFRPRIARSWR